MSNFVWSRLANITKKCDQFLEILFNRGFPPAPVCALDCNSPFDQIRVTNPNRFSLKEIIGNGILWGVPKKRRSIEKRLSRRFGFPELHWKPPVPETNILMCVNCGHHYEAGCLCGHCYERVKKETEIMQAAIQENLGLSPVEQDVVVLYEGEKEGKPDNFWENQRVVEIPKKRPDWFHNNLLQPSTVEPSDSTDVKPTDLA